MLSQNRITNASPIDQTVKAVWQGCFSLCHYRMSKRTEGTGRKEISKT